MMKIKNVTSALFWVLLLTQATFGTSDEQTNGNCLPSERAALLTLKAGFVNPKNRLSSWEGRDCCRWRGITCNSATWHVVKLDLGNTYGRYGLQDEMFFFADMSYALHGEIRSSMLFLQNLNYLDLSYNNFSRSKIPEFIGSLKELRYLNLRLSHFGGRIPPELSSLSNLQYLDLSWNNIYSNDISWLAHLSSLKHLDLSGVNLSSSIHWEMLGTLSHLQALHLFHCGLTETSLSISHVNFTELVTVDLSFNEFSNPVALNWIWNITCLKYLNLIGNNFDGRLPNALRNMISVEELYLGENNLVDMKPTDLKNLTNLKFLDLSENKLIGDITEFIASLSPYRFQSLDLGENNLFGNLSGWIGRMTSLTTLSLYGNNLNGSIPPSIRMLIQLVELDLSDNNFHGEITENHFSGMSNLKKLYLSFNNIRLIVDTNWLPPFRLSYVDLSSCRLGPKFPEWLKWQTDIRFLDISNTSIDDEVPVWFWHVFSKSRRLILSKNNLSGAMPKSLEFMSITQLDLSENQFQGLIPKLPKHLYELDLSRNALSGLLPSNWEGLLLRSLNLRENLLNGSIPQFICQVKHLVFLDLSHNFLAGNIPNCWRSNLNSIEKNYSRLWSSNQSFVKPIALKSLILSHNNLSGEFPKSIKYFNNLILLNLESNNFVGSVPSWIRKKLPSLRFLLLGSNKFNGTIPGQLFKLELLQLLDLSNNNLNGTVPRSLRSLQSLTTLRDDTFASHIPFSIDIGTNPLTDAAPIATEVDTKGQLLIFEYNILYYKSLDLSCNNLVGNIPEEIGALVGLRNLNSSRNKLSGDMPPSVGNLQSLESLDLSNNDLSGSIPLSLSDLTFLSHLNLSNNNLSGRIPSGRQLQALDDPSIYEGNNGLCGFPLPIECSESKTTSQYFISKKESFHNVYVGVVIGFAFGAWIVYGALLFNKSCRVSYFAFVDNMYGRFYVFVIINWARVMRK